MSRVTGPNPYWTMSLAEDSFKRRIEPATSLSMTWVFAHSGSLSVVETTYFGTLERGVALLAQARRELRI